MPEPSQESQSPRSEGDAAKAAAPEASTLIHVEIDFDMATNKFVMRADAPTILLQGVLYNALSSITQNQVLQRIQIAAQAKRVLRPGDCGFNGSPRHG